MVIGRIVQYETYIIIGLFMIAATLSKLLGLVNLSSDWFWFMAGLALVSEGVINLSKQKKFSKKYKVISKQEFSELWGKLEEYEKKK